jgi:D-tyrosyl-tRNA(Tyr) deacylase
MKVIVQRVTSASVSAPGEDTDRIGAGLLLLIGFGRDDKEDHLAPMAQKVANLRIFADEQGRFDRSVLDTGGDVLAVPNFTLYGDCRKGRRPDFTAALAPDSARHLFSDFVRELAVAGIARVAQGFFGAHMQVRLDNDGPVTLVLESA